MIRLVILSLARHNGALVLHLEAGTLFYADWLQDLIVALSRCQLKCEL